MAGRGQRGVNALEAELELEGEAGTAELLIGMLAQEREDLIDFASHRKCSACELPRGQQGSTGKCW